MKKERHPTKKQVQKVIDTFNKVLPAAMKLHRKMKHSVSMMEVSFSPECGTPMCHAGWYAAAKKEKSDYNFGFREAADLIAIDLGFKNHEEVERWAHNNCNIWGNPEGDAMFCSRTAFGAENKEMTLKTIINHWKKVQKRLPR